MKIYQICTKKTYQKDGAEKAVWLPCGSLKVNDDGKQFIELNMFPGQTFYVFEPKQKEDKQDSWTS